MDAVRTIRAGRSKRIRGVRNRDGCGFCHGIAVISMLKITIKKLMCCGTIGHVIQAEDDPSIRQSGPREAVRPAPSRSEDYFVADAAITTTPATPPHPLHPFDVLLQLDKRIRERVPVAATGAQQSEIRGRLALRLGAWIS